MSSTRPQVITQKNHFVPQLYLKAWGDADSKVWLYSLLVPDAKVRPWKQRTTGGIAYHQHLYTRMAGGVETDDFEKWVKREFEDPAVDPIRKALSQLPLTPEDWMAILRFMFMQDARTPAAFLKFRERQIKDFQAVMQDVLEGAPQKLMEAKLAGRQISLQPNPAAEDFPSHFTKQLEPGADVGTLQVEVPVGRRFWLWTLRLPYTRTHKAIRVLNTTIVRPPLGMNWVTSDNPVVKVNYHSPDRYDFGGGYGHPGTEIFFPLGPQHLLYAKVGARSPFAKYQRVPESIAFIFQKLLIEHAHRTVFAVNPDPWVERVRPRYVSLKHYLHEKSQWQRWPEEQSNAELELERP